MSAGLLALVWVAQLTLIVRPVPGLTAVAAVALGLFIVLALTRGSGHIRIFFVLVMAAAALLAWTGGMPQALLQGYERALVFGAFLPSLLLLRATVEASPLPARLHGDVSRLDDAGAQNLTLYGCHVLGTVLTVGAMSILAPIVTREASEERRRRLAAAGARGISLDIMWSPFFVATPFTLQLVPQVPLWQALPLGLVLAAIGFVLAHLLFTRSLDRRAFAASVAQLAPLVPPAAVLIVTVLAASAIFGLAALQSVAIVVPALCAAYLVYRGPRTARFVAARTLGSFARLSEEMLVVVGATTLAVVMAAVPAVQALGASVTPGLLPAPLLMAAMVLAMTVVGLAGMHPMIVVGLIVPVLASGGFGLCAPVIVATAVFAWGLNGALSPWALPLAAASAHFGVPVRGLVSRRTFAYVSLHAIAGIAFLAGVNALCS